MNEINRLNVVIKNKLYELEENRKQQSELFI